MICTTPARATAALSKNYLSGHWRIADICTGLVSGLADEISESHSQRLAPMISVPVSRGAPAGMGVHLSRDVMPEEE